MTERPPEMASMVRHFDYAIDGDVVLASQSDAAIRSLRVKLFRERASGHKLSAALIRERVPTIHGLHRAEAHDRAALRFDRIADAIERGEK